MKIATFKDHEILDARLAEVFARWDRTKAPILPNRREFPETCNFASYLANRSDLDRLDWWHTPNEFASPGASQSWRKIRGGQNKDAGVLSGVSDFIIAKPFAVEGVVWLGLCLEMKRVDATASRLSGSQKAFLMRRRQTGWATAWARGSVEAAMIFEALYGA